MLAIPFGNGNLVIYSNASHQGLGCGVTQRGKVIASSLSELKIHEQNYPTHDLDLMAVVFALKLWIHYLHARLVKFLQITRV